MIYEVSTILIIIVWHGSIFIKKGPYSGGVFKFEIRFPITYPSKIPEVYFTTKVIHPYINESNGKLDLTVSINHILY